jgi:hypothetical protein
MNYTTQTIIEDGKEYEVEIYDNGYVRWFLNGKTHREKGPAQYIGHGDYIYWIQNNILHRLNGPASIYPAGNKFWSINGMDFTKRQHTKIRTMLSLGLDKI